MILKRCPFCGGPASLNEEHVMFGHGSGGHEYSVRCDTCGARGAVFDDYATPAAVCRLSAVRAWSGMGGRFRPGFWDGFGLGPLWRWLAGKKPPR